MTIPLALYIHIPWCIKKCPYCDFNSHVARADVPEKVYLNSLINDFNQQLELNLHQNRLIETIFIGGGTPSLMSGDFYHTLLQALAPHLEKNVEITLEANPGTIDIQNNKLIEFRNAGINRLSFGVQSLQDDKLKYLGRMHSSNNAKDAITLAKQSGFDNMNCDLMFGLPKQSIEDALSDLQGIIDFEPIHISWYQLTIEPNTHFYKRPPVLPHDDYIFEMQQAGIALLAKHGYEQYEVSAYAKNNKQCQHNLNYWRFGDYLGIGAGAHGKTTHLLTGEVTRRSKVNSPKLYQENPTAFYETNIIPTAELPLEFMLNALRLNESITFDLFESRTGINKTCIENTLKKAASANFITYDTNEIKLTAHGKQFLNELLMLF